MAKKNKKRQYSRKLTMANPDYYDLRKLRSLVQKPKGKPKANPNTALFNKQTKKGQSKKR